MKKKAKKDHTTEEDNKTTTDTIGLALHGGSLPAAIAVGGIMRGFQQKKVWVNHKEVPAMDLFTYTSGLSGGNFPNLIYAYAKDTTSDALLDANGVSDPSELTNEEVENIPQGSMFSRFATSITPYIGLALFNVLLFGIQFWEALVYLTFLEPFGIGRDDSCNGPRRDDAKPIPIAETSMVGPLELWPEYLSDQINNRYNMNFLDTYDKNLTATGEIFNLQGTWFSTDDSKYAWELAKMSDFQIPVHAYVTPDEFNIPMQKHTMKFDTISDTNAAADPINFEPVFAEPDDLQPESEGSFTIAKMLAVATNLIPIIAGSLPPDLLPVLNSPLTINIPTGVDGNNREMTLADGGYNDGSGIPALVQKKVRKIICTAFNSGDDSVWNTSPPIYVQNVLLDFFGLTSEVYVYALWRPPTRHIFNINSNGENQLEKLNRNFQLLYDAGEPMITTLKDLEVIENPFFGIEGGYKVDLTVIGLFGVPKTFAKALPVDVASPPNGMNKLNEFGFFNHPDFSTVPNLKSANGKSKIDIPELGVDIDLPFPDYAQETKATKMSYTLTSWMIHHAWNGLWVDNEMIFEGFEKIFE